MCTRTSAQKAEVARQAVLDLRHVIPREIIHELAGDVRDVNRADLIDQDPGIPASDDDLRPETDAWALVEVGMMVRRHRLEPRRPGTRLRRVSSDAQYARRHADLRIHQ